MILTEEKLREIIRDTITKIIETPMLCEMSFPRKTYKEKVRGLSIQLLENWCLVRYCTIVGQTIYKKHWSDELQTHMLTISRWSLKQNDNIQARKKVFDEIWMEEDYNDPQFLTMVVANKFMQEGISIKSDNFIQCIADCINDTNNMIEVILQRNIDEIVSYISKI